jgi:hypothetical protein
MWELAWWEEEGTTVYGTKRTSLSITKESVIDSKN